MSFTIIHWTSDKAWTADDTCMADALVGDKRPSVFGVLRAAGCVHSAFAFLSKLTCQGTRESIPERRELSQPSLATLATAQPCRQVPLQGKILHFSHTHQLSTFQQYQLLGHHSRESRESCIYALYQRRDAPLLKPFVRSDALLPSPWRLWNRSQAQSFLPHTAFQSWTQPPALPNCFSRSSKTSATGLSAPYSLRKQRRICREQALTAGLVLKAWFWPAGQGRWRLTLRAPSAAPWPGLSKGDSSQHHGSECTGSLLSSHWHLQLNSSQGGRQTFQAIQTDPNQNCFNCTMRERSSSAPKMTSMLLPFQQLSASRNLFWFF